LLIVNFIEASTTCSAHLARPKESYWSSRNHKLMAKKTFVIEEQKAGMTEVYDCLRARSGMVLPFRELFCKRWK
jgi:hypothetical protein